jgi:outer membrane protein OmpA-like peptidoglycan-associated protein
MFRMIEAWKPVVAGVALLSLAACAGTQLDAAKRVSPDGADAFSTNLYKEYIGLAQMEFDEGDYQDSDVFAERAMAAAGGAPTLPEELGVRSIPQKYQGEIAEARRNLMAALDAGGRTGTPDHAARAQAMFDCWTQEAEEDIQPEDIKWCRDRFEAALALMGPAPEPTVSFLNYTVYFDLNGTAISPEADATLKDAAAAAKTMPAGSVTVSGYTDRSGTPEYNLALSERRASVVETALKNLMGATAAIFTLEAFGENQNKVITPDGVVNEKNRRVKVEIRK